MNVKLEIFANFLNFWEYRTEQTAHKITKFHSHFELKSTLEGRNNEF